MEQALETICFTGVDSVGLGLAAELDSRDHKRNPKSGKHLIIGNYAYREDLGGSDDYDVYRANFASYHSLAERYVLAWQLSGRWAEQAPIAVILQSRYGVMFAACSLRRTRRISQLITGLD